MAGLRAAEGKQLKHRTPPRAAQQAPRAVQQAPRAAQQPQRSARPSSPQSAQSRPQAAQSRPQASPNRVAPSAPNAAQSQAPSMRNFTRDRDSNLNRTPVQTNRPPQPPVVRQNPNRNVQPNRQPTFARPESRPNVNRPDQNVARAKPLAPTLPGRASLARAVRDRASTRPRPTCGGPIRRTLPLRAPTRSAATSIGRTLTGPMRPAPRPFGHRRPDAPRKSQSSNGS